MALHIKSTKSFKILIGFSALLISIMAATFSVTGIATLFSGYFLAVAFMMGALEFAKIIVASFLARYWNMISKVITSYFITALIILILITSGGIFGYLSDAYQKTKGNYTLVEKNVQLIDTKIKLFISEKDRYQDRLDVLIKTKSGQESRLDSLYSRGQISIARRVETQIAAFDKEVVELTKKLNTINDSISVYETKKVELQSVNITGELGPLKYIAGIFNTDMDTVVKYFIFLLIFVFDPLAILLFVSLNIIIRKDVLEDEYNEKNKSKENKREKEINKEEIKKSAIEEKKNKIFLETNFNKNQKNINDNINTQLKQIEQKQEQEKEQEKEQEIDKKTENTSINESKIEDNSEEFVKELINELEKSNQIKQHNKNEHEFYHNDINTNKNTKENNVESENNNKIIKKSANYHPNI